MKITIEQINEIVERLPGGTGSVASELPQYFQLRRPRKLVAARKCAGRSIVARKLRKGAKDRPLTLPPLELLCQRG